MKRIAVLLVVAACQLLASPTPASAATIQFLLSSEILQPNTNQDNPVSTSTFPLGTLTFTDISPGIVELTLSSSLETATEYFTSVGFNGSWGNNAHLLFTQSGSTGTFNLGGAALGMSNDALSVFPPDRMDYRILFNNPGATSATRFDGTDSLTYIITCNPANLATCGAAGLNALDATDFNVVNSGNSNALHNGWYAVASFGYGEDGDGRNYGDSTGADNVLAVGPTGSVPVPEPGSLLLMGAGLFTLARRRLRAGR